MKVNIIRHILVDLFLIIMMSVIMSYRVTDDLLHEAFGLVILTFIIIHNIINIFWYKSLLLANNSIMRRINAGINILLILSLMVVFTTGVMISQSIFEFLDLKGGLLTKQIHTTAAYWTFLLISIHIGLNWNKTLAMVLQVIGIRTNAHLQVMLLRIIVGISFAMGSVYLFYKDYLLKLIMYFSFDFWDEQLETAYSYIIGFSFIMTFISSGVYYMRKIILNIKINRSEEKNR